MQTSDVISQLDILGIGSEPTRYNIGPEQRYISSLLNSGTNNLEENLKIGQNEIITKWYESNCYREKIEYRANTTPNNYYYIEYYEYDTQPTEIIDGRVSGQKLILDAHNDIENYTNNKILVQKYELYFKNVSLTSELISTRKVYYQKVNGVGYYTEEIEN